MFATQVTSILFLIKRPVGEIGFPFNDTLLKKDTYVYYAYEHAGLVILSTLLFSGPERKYIFMYWLFLVIQLIDWADYHLFYTSNWCYYCLPWNVIKVTLFGVPLVYLTWKNLHQRYHNT